jgi:hypothetical protein
VLEPRNVWKKRGTSTNSRITGRSRKFARAVVLSWYTMKTMFLTVA